MVDKVFENIDVAAQRYDGLARKAIDYGRFQKKIMDRAVAPAPDYSPDEWLGLRDWVTEDFERVGNFKEVMTGEQMITMLQKWAPNANWEGSFKRVTEHDNIVILELEERALHDGKWNAVNSVSVYEFNEEGKLRHLDVYLQAVPGDVTKGEQYD